MGVPTRYKPGRRGAVDSEDETAAGSSRASSSSRREVPGSDALEKSDRRSPLAISTSAVLVFSASKRQSPSAKRTRSKMMGGVSMPIVRKVRCGGSMVR